jgi:hypothetical protein
MSLEEFLECIDDNYNEVAKAIIDWANGLDLDFYICCRCNTKRIAFRVPYKDNKCTTKNVFLTIKITSSDRFIYLLNWTGVDMSDQDNWNEATYLTLDHDHFNNTVTANYHLRLDQLADNGDNDLHECPDLDNFDANRTLDIVRKYHFKKIGSYVNKDGGIDVKKEKGVRTRKKFKMVYALISESEVKYIGESKNGYARALSYHKNNVMGTVKTGIQNQVSKEKEVDIYVRCKGFELSEDSIKNLPPMNLYKAVEKSLIEEFKPAWNKDK